ncbi:hypothetical protein THAOC_13371 [Thalassiosira oceanica]|uniref:Uncharacterized protein n=1 Tax=Thalassiosira oceanica TaxID=159749 RepID=K0SKB9_THAOC|nr:hypothetical protein THAOC_13371 [Thalassiosira oceanica]|eukprot:EJK65745.1 hypothetical protein THAOC_13371 [Thalassiosira oceanica]
MGCCHTSPRKTAHASTVTKVPGTYENQEKTNKPWRPSLGRGELLHNHEPPPSNGDWQHRKQDCLVSGKKENFAGGQNAAGKAPNQGRGLDMKVLEHGVGRPPMRPVAIIAGKPFCSAMR